VVFGRAEPRYQKRKRSIVQYTAVQAMSAAAGTTMRLWYQVRSAQDQPTSRNARPITVSCPISTPMLNVTSAVANSERVSARSFSAPANPRPCSNQNAKTRAIEW